MVIRMRWYYEPAKAVQKHFPHHKLQHDVSLINEASRVGRELNLKDYL